MYAFVGHESACEALRLLFPGRASVAGARRWPEKPRLLPPAAECVSGQRDFKRAHVGEALDRIGLTDRPVDLLVHGQRARSDGKAARFHVWSGVLPTGSLFQVDKNLLVSGPELVVLELCSAQGKLDALLDAHAEAVRAEAELAAALGSTERPVLDHPLEWESIRRLIAATVVACEFAGTYRLGAGERPVAYRAPQLMDAGRLRRAIGEVGRAQGARRAGRVCELMLEGSASPMETVLALMLTLPPDLGGFGMERPLLNHPLDVSGLRGSLSDRDVVMPDLLWEDRRVALEYDSREFHARRGEGRAGEDAARANILTALGYRVFRVTAETVRTLAGVSLLARQVARALGTELPETTPLQDLRRRKLYLLLMPQVHA